MRFSLNIQQFKKQTNRRNDKYGKKSFGRLGTSLKNVLIVLSGGGGYRCLIVGILVHSELMVVMDVVAVV